MRLGVGVVAAVVAWSVLSPRAAHAQTPPDPDAAAPAPDTAPTAPVAVPTAPDAVPPAAIVAPLVPLAAPPAPDAAPPSADAAHLGLNSIIPGATVVSRCAYRETSSSRFLAAGFGMGGVSRIGDVPPTFGSSFRLQFGQRLAHRLHLVEETNLLVEQRYLSPFPTDTSEQHITFGAGVRWTMFEPRPILNPAHFPGPYLDLNAFYVAAILGADVRSRATWVSPTQSTYESAWTPMASVGLGWLPLQGHDWSLGEEFREQLAYYDGHVQREWMALVVAELQQW